jgi:hypothetical protein
MPARSFALPLLWSLVVEEPVALQTALCINQQWYDRTTFSINPNKTVIIFLTRKRDIRGHAEPNRFNNTIPASRDVKYLRLRLDKELIWKSRWIKKLIKHTGLLYVRKYFWKTCGPKPKVIYWIYIMVVRLIVTYASTAWLPRVNFYTGKVELGKLQRMACLGISGSMKTAPAAVI